MAYKVKNELKRKREPIIKDTNLYAEGIGVDSGTIAITDRKGRKDEDIFSSKVFKVPNGTYKVEWFMPDTWKGDVRGVGEVEVKTGEIIVADPCYFPEYKGKKGDARWQKLLKKTDFFRKTPKGWTILDKHGGDGYFDVQIKLSKIK